jgi:hypothetical protein
MAAAMVYQPFIQASGHFNGVDSWSGNGHDGVERVRARTIIKSPLSFLRQRPSFRIAFREMMRERLVLLLFVTSLLTPRIDVSAFVWHQFRQGPSAVGYIKALESMTVILVPLSGVIPAATQRLGHAAAAVACAALMAMCWLTLGYTPGAAAWCWLSPAGLSYC